MRLLTWLGGAAFVASLAYLVYFYLVTLGSPDGPPAAALPHALIDAALFTAFATHHSLFARSRVKRLVERLAPPPAERSLYVWTSSVLLAAVCGLWQPVPGLVYDADGVWRLLLVGVQIAGVTLTIRGAAVLDPLELAGVRAARAAEGAFTVAGPYGAVRHPIYLGWILMVGATPAMTANRAVFALVSSAYLILAIPWEERSLVAAHGAAYRAYQTRVRWRLLPGIW